MYRKHKYFALLYWVIIIDVTYGHCEESKEHLARTEEAGKEEDDEGTNKVVGLVVKEVADQLGGPLLRAGQLWHLKPRITTSLLISNAMSFLCSGLVNFFPLNKI